MNEFVEVRVPFDCRGGQRRFVVLEHDHPHRHWDLLIEAGDCLASWRLDESVQAGRRIAATRIPDHRLLYLDYEGPVSGNRGHVTRVCAGILEPDLDSAEFRILDCSVAERCRLEESEDDSCWWVFG